jgi:hypothetical protein
MFILRNMQNQKGRPRFAQHDQNRVCQSHVNQWMIGSSPNHDKCGTKSGLSKCKN